MGKPSSLVPGIFLLACGLLLFEIFSTRVMAFVLGSGYIYFVIGLAMLGLGAAASVISVLSERRRALIAPQVLFWGPIALGVTLLVHLFLVVELRLLINEGLEIAAREGGFKSLVQKLISGRLYVSLWFGLSMSVPYFLFGAIITTAFNATQPRRFPRLYFADLVGAGLGCALAIAALELVGYSLAAVLPITLSFLAAACFRGAPNRGRVRAATVVVGLLPLLLVLPSIEQRLEPVPQLNQLARDYDFKEEISEFWHGWNSFSRVGALRWEDMGGQVHHKIALGNGEGHAHLDAYNPDGYGDWNQRVGVLAMSFGVPESALILFAGVGSDMLALDSYAGHQSEITGVELNHTMARIATLFPQFRLEEFFARPNIHYVVQEARTFLEQDRNRYDIIVLSWSGATTAYYSGSIGHTTQFVYTYEAMTAIFERLKPDGALIMFNTNKVNSLASLRELMREKGLESPERAAVVLYKPGFDSSRWQRGWDENPLIIKPSGFSASDVTRIAAAGREIGLEIAYAPTVPVNEEYSVYRRVLTGPDLGATLSAINAESGLRFSVVTDDRPFSFDLFQTHRYLEPGFWRQVFDSSLETAYENYRAQQVIFVAALALAAVVLVVGPLLWRGGPELSIDSGYHLVFFCALGTGFMLVEIGIIHKMGLPMGNPGLSIAIVLAALIVFTGLGSLASARTFARGLSFTHCVGFILVYLSIYLIVAERFVSAILPWNLFGKSVAVLALIAPVGLAMGHLFPQGLVLVSRSNPSLIPWAWAINAVTGTVAAGVAPLLAQAFGFRLVIVTGAAMYALVLLLPPYRSRPRER